MNCPTVFVACAVRHCAGKNRLISEIIINLFAGATDVLIYLGVAYSYIYLNLSQEDYVAEGITWQTIGYTDNSGCIELVSQKSTGLLALLDEESK